MRSLVEGARKCYAEHVELNDDEFAEMRLLDSCFVVEVIREIYGERRGERLIRRMDWMINGLQRDLMLFENQLPFFVILRMLDLIVGGPNSRELFIYLAFMFFSDLFKAEGSHMFDITFKNGVMHIPNLRIVDRTECVLRNLFVYEQYKVRTRRFIVTDYAALLDSLINTSKDVEILCKSGIVDNWLGDDEVVSGLFNKILDSALVFEHFHYADLCNRVNAYYNKKMNRFYLNSPWAVISVVTAIILWTREVSKGVYGLGVDVVGEKIVFVGGWKHVKMVWSNIQN
ncbi:hypothetical protein Leryth_020554 [Lithospermum erythrorhizon]|nr:hypothetical protein Leryth_020554 [Lithospermum erythrorhizon]